MTRFFESWLVCKFFVAVVLLQSIYAHATVSAAQPNVIMLAKQFRDAYPVQADLSSISAVLTCASGARLLLARDHYGQLLIGIPAEGKTVSFEWRGTWINQVGNDFLIVPFWPVSGPEPPDAEIFLLSEQASCDAATTPSAAVQKAVPTVPSSWPLVSQRYVRPGARFFAHAESEPGGPERVAFLLEDPEGPRVVLCSREVCVEQGLFKDARQRQVSLKEPAEVRTADGQTAFRLKSMQVLPNRVVLTLITTVDASVLEQTLSVWAQCPTSSKAIGVYLCPMR